MPAAVSASTSVPSTSRYQTKIAFLLRWLTSHSTAIFVAYRVVLGTLVIALTAAGAIS